MKVLKEAAEQTGDLAGDGTSTPLILAHAILVSGVRNIGAHASAINATKAAVEEGVVAGGGLTLLLAIAAIEREVENCQGDERTGVLILRRKPHSHDRGHPHRDRTAS